VRSWNAHQSSKGTTDTCPRFTEPVVRAWQLPCIWLDDQSTPDTLTSAYMKARKDRQPLVVLFPE
jgi:hypothetical protein